MNKRVVLIGFLVVVGLVAIVGGSYWLLQVDQQLCLEARAPTTFSAATASAQLNTIAVDVAGAVDKPGFYQLPQGSRLADLLELAELSSQVDPTHVSQELNLAQKLEDGDKIYLRSLVEAKFGAQATEFCANYSSASGQNPDSTGSEQLISINFASQKELESLTGIGEKRATDIMAGRPYQSLSELVSRQILSQAIFKEIEQLLKL